MNKDKIEPPNKNMGSIILLSLCADGALNQFQYFYRLTLFLTYSITSYLELGMLLTELN